MRCGARRGSAALHRYDVKELFSMSFYRKHGKRWLDLAIAIPAALVLSPIILGAAILTRWKLGSPVLFRQRRPGLNERIFHVFKFRTMKDLRDAHGSLLPDAERLPAFGVWMRKLSLDELPQLLNVLRGDMSLVGPRPLLEQYLSLYNDEQRLRHSVRPGITGKAQINGRNAASWDQRFADDVWYVRHLTLQLDLSILLQTAGKVFRSKDISRPGHVTMPVFEGNRAHPAAAGQSPRESECRNAFQ